MIAIIDYGVGNLFSLKCSLEKIGCDVIVTKDPAEITKADKLILPGVGAFGDAANKLHDSGLAKLIIQLANSGKPLLGICLGMQLLFERSYEYGVFEGLGLIKGEIKPIDVVIDSSLKVPHIGWNYLKIKDNPLFKYINDGDFVYFVHSYAAFCNEEDIIAKTEYSAYLTAAVNNKNVYGCQFHPEKSGDVGLNILKAFMEV